MRRHEIDTNAEFPMFWEDLFNYPRSHIMANVGERGLQIQMSLERKLAASMPKHVFILNQRRPYFKCCYRLAVAPCETQNATRGCHASDTARQSVLLPEAPTTWSAKPTTPQIRLHARQGRYETVPIAGNV